MDAEIAIANGRAARERITPVPDSFAKFLHRVKNAAGADEMSTLGPYGDALVPEEWARRIFQVGTVDPSAALVTRMLMRSGTLNVGARVDKDHSTSVTGGFDTDWRTETQEKTASRGEVELIKLSANSAVGLTFATDELIEDSPIAATEAIIGGLRTEFAGLMLDKKINGTGVGEPEGVLNASCKIKVTRSGANTITGTDIVGMFERCWNPQESIWLANPNAYDQISTAGLLSDVGTTDQLYLQHGWREYNPDGSTKSYVPNRLCGMPIFFTEFCQTLATEGDLILWQPSEYLWGVRSETLVESAHVRYVNHERAFRFTCRCDGRAWWRTPLTMRYAESPTTQTLSPIVTLSTNT